MNVKIVFTGACDAVAATAVDLLSGMSPIVDDNAGTAQAPSAVGCGYRILRLGPTDRIHLFGIPGAVRPDAMWGTLAREAIGVAIVIDNSQDDPLSLLDESLAGLGDHLDNLACVVAVMRPSTCPGPGLDDFVARLAARGRVFPVVEADVRIRGDVLMLVALLIAQADAARSVGTP